MLKARTHLAVLFFANVCATQAAMHRSALRRLWAMVTKMRHMKRNGAKPNGEECLMKLCHHCAFGDSAKIAASAKSKMMRKVVKGHLEWPVSKYLRSPQPPLLVRPIRIWNVIGASQATVGA